MLVIDSKPFITPDFPKPGVNFIDVFKLLNHHYVDPEFFYSACPIAFVPESRGFLMFTELYKNSYVLPIRKNKNLPGNLMSYPSKKEYGSDILSFQVDLLEEYCKKAEQSNLFLDGVVPITFYDDILATGQTAKCFQDLIESINVGGYRFVVKSFNFLVEIESLKGRQLLSNVNSYFMV